MKEWVLESGITSLFKHDEPICGDFQITLRHGGAVTSVLSDGLGSGVKANILATLTAKILSTMVNGAMPIASCISTMAQTLPVCSVRHLAYATFTLLQVTEEREAYLVQFDNPAAILVRDGKVIDYDKAHKLICGKDIFESRFTLEPGDMLVMMSDGVTSSGLGKTTSEGWGLEGVKSFVQSWYSPEVSAKRMSNLIVQACRDLALGQTDDDTTALVFRLRERCAVNLIVGPPERKEDDERVLHHFFSLAGKHIVCGGTTAKTVSHYLDRPIRVEEDTADDGIPAVSSIKGVDLVTEGFLTLTRVTELAREYNTLGRLIPDYSRGKDGASRLAQLLFEEASDIHFFVGQAVNPAHNRNELGLDLKAKLEMVESLAGELEKMGKEIKITAC